ncbi:MAG: ComF family protein [Phycisphaerae bacterium]
MGKTLGALAASAGELARGLADLVLPAVCPGCNAAEADGGGGLCRDCQVKLLSLVALPYCPRCGTSVGPNIPLRTDGCSACPDTLPRFCQVVRLGPYAPPLRGIVRALKYWRQAPLAGRAGRLLAQAAATHLGEAAWDVVIPVPMHWRRRLSRPADHARIVAGQLAAGLGLPVGDELIRLRHTPPQAHLSRTRRIENIRGAFGIRRGGAIGGANVLLVDDVTTTGATANEAAKTLLAGGACKVALAVIAKAEPPTAYAAAGV